MATIDLSDYEKLEVLKGNVPYYQELILQFFVSALNCTRGDGSTTEATTLMSKLANNEHLTYEERETLVGYYNRLKVQYPVLGLA